MSVKKSESLVRRLLEIADVSINGSNPWDMQVHDSRVYDRIIAQANLGLGESYMDGWWDCAHLDQFFDRVLSANLQQKINPVRLLGHYLRAKFLNRQTPNRAWQVGQSHYDLSNDFYAAMLDSRMTYTCGYWRDANSLEQAQKAKLELICRKLKLEPGMRLLDIGCGWGSLMSYAAEKYAIECVGVTVSQAQVEWAEQRYSKMPLTFRLQDYRDLHGSFDRVVSVGMFEHVGRKNYGTFFDVARRCLKSDGLLLLHTIGKNKRKSTPDPWIDRYIFPNGELPSIEHIGEASGGKFVIEDLHNFGADYDKTLMAWPANFARAWPQFQTQRGDTFERMWRYYLLSCAGAFRARDIQLWQWILSPTGVRGGYIRV
ncbi:cyclopropane fatty acyl phospholipid synthase [Aliidiomarina haloalkalitolerans]|uniref:Cyclopropane-fatty-acyl-phospholipid synthase n=1 Tax=Aliidiomarina haloalkalitolerans TaxID=859059 RepID=A0A432VYS3_9GAMM|nr:cyclopropane fatty acyl phospholipid synthase [Aliidiomarina haloalkalitolerans]RUO21814.1 cyclopropane-fatty-acyl-phospholipid synthase [Aliidiomarina haloalkalitolerans]